MGKKLGIKPGGLVWLIGSPKWLEPGLRLETAATYVSVRPSEPADVIVWFVTEMNRLEEGIAGIHEGLSQSGGLWVAWPKRASGVVTDVTEDGIRDVALPRGLVDNKVCAIDSTWSGLRLVIRLENRSRSRA